MSILLVWKVFVWTFYILIHITWSYRVRCDELYYGPCILVYPINSIYKPSFNFKNHSCKLFGICLCRVIKGLPIRCSSIEMRCQYCVISYHIVYAHYINSRFIYLLGTLINYWEKWHAFMHEINFVTQVVQDLHKMGSIVQ